jgi:Uma2 family endonuclease
MAVASVAGTETKLLTAEEFLHYPSGEGRQELVRGRVVEMAPAGGGHGDTQTEFVLAMKPVARAQHLGFVISETGFILSRAPDVVRAPDVAFIAHDRLPGGLPEGFIEGPPDIAVEIVSPGDTHTEVMEKIGEYLAAGARLVWVASRRSRTVTVHRSDGTAQTLRADDVLSGEDVMPGFEVRVADLFG